MKIVKDPHFYMSNDDPTSFNIQVSKKELDRFRQMGEAETVREIRAFLEQNPLGQRWLLSGFSLIQAPFPPEALSNDLDPNTFDIYLRNPANPQLRSRTMIVSSSYRLYNKYRHR